MLPATVQELRNVASMSIPERLAAAARQHSVALVPIICAVALELHADIHRVRTLMGAAQFEAVVQQYRALNRNVVWAPPVGGRRYVAPEDQEAFFFGNLPSPPPEALQNAVLNFCLSLPDMAESNVAAAGPGAAAAGVAAPSAAASIMPRGASGRARPARDRGHTSSAVVRAVTSRSDGSRGRGVGSRGRGVGSRGR